jgi:hypothetical protein
MITTCSGGSFSLDLIHWFAGFVSFHGGAIGGPDEFDATRGAFVVTGWQPGSNGVCARRTFDRSGQDDDVTFRERTTLEIRGPSYRAN